MELKKEKVGVTISFSMDEALVFLDWLIRFNESEQVSFFEDQAEERILFDLESVLEKSISDLLIKDYKNLLLEARDKIRDE